MTPGQTIIYLPPAEDDPEWGPRVRFRLTYQGELKASGRDPETGQRDRMAEHKQMIRKVFHHQLKQLWATNEFLKEHKMYPGDTGGTRQSIANEDRDYGHVTNHVKQPMAEIIANLFKENDYRFVPLVRREISLLCSLHVLFLRRDFPGFGVINAGDLDNRIKTLIDALRKPHSANELSGNEKPADGEDPFFCLLEDDNLVTALSVETDALLDPPANDPSQSQVKLIITVELKPLDVTMFNLGFA